MCFGLSVSSRAEFEVQFLVNAKNQTVKFELAYEKALKALKKVFLIMEFEVNNN